MSATELLLLCLVCISAGLALTCVFAWSLFERPRHALIWSLSYIMLAVQYSINYWRELLPSADTYWLSANFASFVMITLAIWGHRDRLLVNTPLYLVATPVVLLTLCTAALMARYPAPGPAAALAPLYACLGLAYVAVLLWRSRRQPKLTQRFAALSHLGFGITQLAAALSAGFAASADPQQQQVYITVNFGILPATFVVMVISVFFLMATDLSQRLSTLALTDLLTGLTNRRGFLQVSERSQAMAARTRQPLSLVVADLDHFKGINDRYGHIAGDHALRHVAQRFQSVVRLEDVCGRVGGEEFAILLNNRGVKEAAQVAERMQKSLAESPVRVGRQTITVTASFGIAQWLPGESYEDWMDRADRHLYLAKAGGRDQISVATDTETASVIGTSLA